MFSFFSLSRDAYLVVDAMGFCDSLVANAACLMTYLSSTIKLALALECSSALAAANLGILEAITGTWDFPSALLFRSTYLRV
jgi:hypothetical protein